MRTKEEILKHGRLIRDYGVMFSGLIGELVELVEDQDSQLGELVRQLEASDEVISGQQSDLDYLRLQSPSRLPDWLHSPEAMAERLMRAGWRPDGDAQHSELRAMFDEVPR